MGSRNHKVVRHKMSSIFYMENSEQFPLHVALQIVLFGLELEPIDEPQLSCAEDDRSLRFSTKILAELSP